MWKPDLIEDIEEFHEKYDLAYRGVSRHLSKEEKEFRIRCLNEELLEYSRANTLTEELDAIIDIVYFAIGTAYRHGFSFYDGWKEVHRSNMEKVRAASKKESKRDYELDVVKPEGWTPPDLKEAVENEQCIELKQSDGKGYYATKRKNLTDAKTKEIIQSGQKLPPAEG